MKIMKKYKITVKVDKLMTIMNKTLKQQLKLINRRKARKNTNITVKIDKSIKLTKKYQNDS